MKIKLPSIKRGEDRLKDIIKERYEVSSEDDLKKFFDWLIYMFFVKTDIRADDIPNVFSEYLILAFNEYEADCGFVPDFNNQYEINLFFDIVLSIIYPDLNIAEYPSIQRRKQKVVRVRSIKRRSNE